MYKKSQACDWLLRAAEGASAFRPHQSRGSFSSAQTVHPRCSRTCRGWRSGPAAVSRLARNVVALCYPWWARGARPASEGDAAARRRWETTGRAAGRWADWAPGGWEQQARWEGRVLSTQAWDNRKGPSWKKERVSQK